MFGMNAQQIEGQVRIFLAMFTGVAGILGLTWYGAVSEAFINTIGPVFGAITPISALVTIVWSLITKKQANILATAKGLTDERGAPIVEHIALAPTAAGVRLQNETPAGVSVGLPAPATGPLGTGSMRR